MNKHTPKQHLTAYDSDYVLWSERQAALIRERRFDELDIENIAEEIESLGRSDRRALGSQLRRLLIHLLKWQYQQSRRSQSWRTTINSARDELRVILEESPSLKAALIAGLDREYQTARKRAAQETGLPSDEFSSSFPYTLAALLDEDFWPNAGE